ncbi:LysR family transcriptional regulator [Piscinibacter aquaticus]|uniref:LysR family transcriptional regulator n=1 Tax=Piscinibacter aquaticus TaxID=392597 RepID=A0A5C6U2E2_9BURK|nr:LysR family transcriptional regulator [Piscinibacter aquaticus]
MTNKIRSHPPASSLRRSTPVAPDAGALEFFARVAAAESFAAAARDLGQTRAAVSRRVALLEAELGVPLFARHTRAVGLTEAGRRLLARARAVLEAAEAARRTLRSRSSGLTGTLRITTVPVFGQAVLGPLLAAFQARHPELQVELRFTARRVDLLREDIDLAFRITDRPPEDCIAQPVLRFAVGAFAAPGLKPKLRRPEDWRAHAARCSARRPSRRRCTGGTRPPKSGSRSNCARRCRPTTSAPCMPRRGPAAASSSRPTLRWRTTGPRNAGSRAARLAAAHPRRRHRPGADLAAGRGARGCTRAGALRGRVAAALNRIPPFERGHANPGTLSGCPPSDSTIPTPVICRAPSCPGSRPWCQRRSCCSSTTRWPRSSGSSSRRSTRRRSRRCSPAMRCRTTPSRLPRPMPVTSSAASRRSSATAARSCSAN